MSYVDYTRRKPWARDCVITGELNGKIRLQSLSGEIGWYEHAEVWMPISLAICKHCGHDFSHELQGGGVEYCSACSAGHCRNRD